MRRELRLRLLPAGAWTLATGAAVALSWFGVHTVLSGTDYEPPRALPVSDATSATAEPRSSSTHRPKPSPSSSPPSREKPPEKSSKPPEPTPTKKPGKSREPSRTPKPDPEPEPGPGDDGKVKGATVTGGRAVFDMGEKSATLVSATPNAGWDMRVWDSQTWIRVTFTKGDSSATVFCRWNDSAPRIETFSD
ncbi:hypothetical protein GCM10009801_54920 [Streptomyces albiaxialis]|uniref:Secreted protein n=1 Tax=Streptomyces albiaxialis TaxID=329523 RepID=A0ABN2WEU9_9ACTN